MFRFFKEPQKSPPTFFIWCQGWCWNNTSCLTSFCYCLFGTITVKTDFHYLCLFLLYCGIIPFLIQVIIKEVTDY